MRILVTGATGYIGGRLVPRLLEEGHSIRVLVRDPRRIAGHAWAGSVEIATGDLFDPASLERACGDLDAAYYLVHSMTAGGTFSEMDRTAAANFSAAARSIPRVIYLGGLLPASGRHSEHLRSRAEVGEILRRDLPTLEFRAGPIIGSGSASFEMVRYLTERLPAMVAPRWIDNPVQPIAIRDVLEYLVRALDTNATGVVDIGSDRLTFKDMMTGYATVRGLKRWIVPVPVLAPRLAGLWVGLVTPITNRLALPLIEGIVTPVVADTARARELFPSIEVTPYRDAVALAIRKTETGDVETRWSGAFADAPSYELTDREGMMREVRTIPLKSSARDAFEVFTSLGGSRGWRVWDWAWRLRGLLDRLIGGPGLRRGRRHPQKLLVGEALDFWRVEEIVPDRLLRLRAEMKVPGRAWLQYEVVQDDETTHLVQTAIFEPRGLSGALYWWLLYPLHRLIFSDMARAVAAEAEKRADLAPSEDVGAPHSR